MDHLSPDDLLVVVSYVHPTIDINLLRKMIEFTSNVRIMIDTILFIIIAILFPL